MGEFQNFAEILEKKIRKELQAELNAQNATQANHDSNRSFETHRPTSSKTTIETSYAHLGWLLGQTPVVKTQKSYLKTPYVHSKKTVQKRASSRPAHQLAGQSLEAFGVLKKYSADFADSFNENELRKAYRKALLVTHPDHGGNAQALWEVRQAYSILKQIL